MKRILLSLSLLAISASGLQAENQCKNGVCQTRNQRSVYRQKIVYSTPACKNGACRQHFRLSHQSLAEAKVRISIRSRFRGHVGTHLGMGGAAFEGCGMSSSSPHNVPTCTPRRPMRLVGDATARGPDGWHRVRLWQ